MGKQKAPEIKRFQVLFVHALFDEESFVPMAMIKEGRSYSILTDQLGTPTEAYDAEGHEVWSRVLDMDGNVIEETGNKGMVPFLLQGQYYDCETGLAYNRFRYYDPKMGMYVSCLLYTSLPLGCMKTALTPANSGSACGGVSVWSCVYPKR